MRNEWECGGSWVSPDLLRDVEAHFPRDQQPEVTVAIVAPTSRASPSPDERLRDSSHALLPTHPIHARPRALPYGWHVQVHRDAQPLFSTVRSALIVGSTVLSYPLPSRLAESCTMPSTNTDRNVPSDSPRIKPSSSLMIVYLYSTSTTRRVRESCTIPWQRLLGATARSESEGKERLPTGTQRCVRFEPTSSSRLA